MDTMDTSMDTSEKYLRKEVETWINDARDKYGYPERWLADEDGWIDYTARLDGGRCAELMLLTERGLEPLKTPTGTYPPPPILYLGSHLLGLASKADYRELIQEEAKNYGDFPLYLGFTFFRILYIARFKYLFNAHQNALDLLHVAYADYAEDDPEFQNIVLRSQNRLAQFISKSCKPEELMSPIWEEACKTFTGKIVKDIALATSGDKGADYAPHRIYQRLIDEYRKHKRGIPLDTPAELGYDPLIRDSLEIAKLEEGLEQLTKKQREVVKLRYEYGLTFEEIGGRLGVSKQTVQEHEKAALLRLKEFFTR